MRLKNKLKKLLVDENTTELEKDVIGTVLQDYETDKEINSFFIDLSSHGCVSGMISHLIYYKDTHEYYNTHADDIESLLEEMKENAGAESVAAMVTSGGDLRNTLAWFGFEEAARKVAGLIGIEI